MRLRRAFPALFLLCPFLLQAAPAPRLAFTPAEWKFGMVIQGAQLEQTVSVTSSETSVVAVTFVPTCSCLGVTPATRTISPGGVGTFHLTFDTSDDVGITTRGFIVRTDVPGTGPAYYLVRGVVRTDNTASATAPAAASAAAPGAGSGAAPSAAGWRVTVTYYYTPGCRVCEQFIAVETPRLAVKLARDRGLVLVMSRKDVLDPASYQELASFADARGEALRAIPALAVGETLLQGDQVIRDRLPGILESIAAGPAPAPVSAAGPSTAGRIAVLPVVAAGLLDGINPCAFTTLIFLIASLALAGRGRGEILAVGAAFTVSVFLSYFLIGLGFFTALRAAGAVAIVSLVLRWLLFAVLVLFAALSVYDYLLIRRGKPTEMLLQLPMALKRRIHASIRVRVRAAALAGSSLVLGFLVSIFEFACTGQVYLPTLAWLARAGKRLDAVGLLALYNLAFIVPLLFVFAASYAGVSSARITSMFQAHMGKVKLLLAVVFAALAVVTLVG